MPIDLIPIPVKPDLPPWPDDPDQQKAWMQDFTKRFNDLYGILRQDVNRLATPPSRAATPVTTIEELGYVLAVLYNSVGNPPLDVPNEQWPPAPRYVPNRIRAFLKKFSFSDGGA